MFQQLIVVSAPRYKAGEQDGHYKSWFIRANHPERSETFWIPETHVAVSDWIAGENHNWGSKHTDRYAWGQVLGLDEAPDALSELVSTQHFVARLCTPRLTFLVLGLEGKEFRLNTPFQTLRNHANLKNFE